MRRDTNIQDCPLNLDTQKVCLSSFMTNLRSFVKMNTASLCSVSYGPILIMNSFKFTTPLYCFQNVPSNLYGWRKISHNFSPG